MARRAGLITRAAPVGIAAAFAAAYVLLAPPSADLAAQLYRAHLVSAGGFSIWDNGWYGGQSLPGYSVLAPALFSLLGAQLAAGLAAVGTAAIFDRFARGELGPRAWAGSTLFGAATAISLYTGRLTLTTGLLPGLAAVVALRRRQAARAVAAAALTTLLSPVAGLFAAIAAVAIASGEIARTGRPRDGIPGALVALTALAPVAIVAVLFGAGGTEPFALGTLLPLLAICLGGLAAAPRDGIALRAGILLYLIAVLGAYLIPSPVGSNIARLGTLLAAPVAGLLWWRRHPRRLAVLLLPLLYVGWQAPVIDTAQAAGDPAASARYYAPLLRFLAAQPGVFRTEVVFTADHWEAYWVGRRFPLARGWERQLDRGDNPLFYRGRLTAAAYRGWLAASAVRFVALPDASLDPSAQGEARLVRRGLPYLRPVMRSAHWRVYAVRRPGGLASGPAEVTQLGSDWLTVRVRAAGRVLLRVRDTPYWRLTRGDGCVEPAPGGLTEVTAPRAETLRLVARFDPSRIGARSPACTGPDRPART